MIFYFIPQDIRLRQKAEFVLVFDGTGLVLNHFRTFTAHFSQSVARHLKESLVAHLEAVHVINVPLHILSCICVFRSPLVRVHIQPLFKNIAGLVPF